VIEFVFWGSAGFVCYAYAGYPAALYVVACLRNCPVRRGDITPSVSLIITARNEEQRIGPKLDNTLALDYPADRLELIVASDCSTDGTHAIVQRHAEAGVRLVVTPERRGKEFAQKMAIDASSGDILVFSDVATRLDRDGVRTIVRNFADADVGCVSSVDRLIGSDGQASGEGAYVRYEMFLRALESQIDSVVGLSGSFFAARREVCAPWASDLPSDFTTLLNTITRGLRGVSDPNAIGYYPNLTDERGEYARKVRTISRGLASFSRHLQLLNPLRYGLVAWQLFSHKLCRWLVPYALIGLLVSNAMLVMESPLYAVLGVAQILAYGTAVSALRRRTGRSGFPGMLAFFVLVNVSILNAWCNVLRGRTVVVWEPSRR
jgi:hypothetical protein